MSVLCQCGCVHYLKRISVMSEMSVWGRPRELRGTRSDATAEYCAVEPQDMVGIWDERRKDMAY